MPAEPARHLAVVPDTTPKPAPPDANGPALERTILGTAMESRSDLDAIRAAEITADHFADARHGLLWNVIVGAADQGAPVTVTAINELLVRSGDIARMPHPAYLADVHQAADPSRGAWYAGKLAERHQRRILGHAKAELDQAIDTPGIPDEVIAERAQRVRDAAVRTATTNAPLIGDLANAYFDNYLTDDDADGLLVAPWVDLTRLLGGGFRRGQVLTFGAASGVGKSIALADLARHIAVKQGRPTAYFSMEMTEDEITYRVLSAISRVPETLIKRKQLTADDIVKVDDARWKLQGAPLRILSGSFTAARIANETRKLARDHGSIEAVVVDYVQLVTATGRHENRQLAVSSTMQHLKQFALEENVFVATAAQINRAPDQRSDKRPQLADLRESGEIANSSDIVIMIYRDDYYDPESARAGEADFIVKKNRGGPCDTVTVAAQLHLTRFVDMAVL
jgi:replicative DNA helicase